MPAVPGYPAVARVGGGPTGPGVLLPGRRDCSGWSAGRQGLEAGDGGCDLAGPGPALREAQPQPVAAAGEPSGDGERRRRSRLGSQRRAVPVRAGSCVQARSSLAQGGDLAPQLVLGEALQRRQTPQPRCPSRSGSAPRTWPACGGGVPGPRAGRASVGGEGGEPVPVNVGEPQLRARVRPFLADDDPHPGRPGGKVHQAGDVRDPRAVTDLPVAVIGGVHADAGTFPIADCTSSVLVIPAE